MTNSSDRASTGGAVADCCPRLAEPSLSEADAEMLANALKALADPVRLRLVNIIAAAGEGCACDFPAELDRSQPTISHHLSVLVKAGILGREQRGKWAWFWVETDRLAEVRAALTLG